MSANPVVPRHIDRLYEKISENEENLAFLYWLDREEYGTDEDLLSEDEIDQLPNDLVRPTGPGYELTEVVNVYFEEEWVTKSEFCYILEEEEEII